MCTVSQRGSLGAKIIHNVYIVNGRTKVGLVSPMTLTSDSSVTFKNMVKQ